MMVMRAHSSGKVKRGSTLVAVFWLMSILTLAVFTSLRLLFFEVDLVTSQVHGNKAGQMAEMGIAVAANQAVELTDYHLLEYQDPANDSGYSVQIKSEGTRFNINSILMKRQTGEDPDKALLRELFADWGIEVEDVDDIVDALVDWVDEDELEELNGAEASYYEELGFLNRPYNRGFYSLDEMRLVRGMDLVDRANPNWQDWFTIWSTRGLDVNEAPAELIARAAEVTPADAEAVAAQVLGPDGIRGNEDDQPFRDVNAVLDALGVPEIQRAIVGPRLNTSDPVTRIESTGWSGETRRRITLIVRNRVSARPSVMERWEEMVP